MGAKTFLDTNVLLRVTTPSLPLYREAQKLVIAQQNTGTELWISRQVIREYLVQITRPQSFMHPMSPEQVENQVRYFNTAFHIADENAEVTTQLLQLLKTHPTGGKQIHDANIIATMLVYGVDTLLTTNIDDMKRFEDKIRLIPLGGEAN